MKYYCELCLRNIEKKTKNSHQKSKSLEEFAKLKHILLSLKNVDIKDVDEILYLNMIDHNKKLNPYLIIGESKLIFNDNQDCKNITTCMIDNRTFISRSNYLRDAVNILKEVGFHFNYVAEMDFATLAHKRDTTYDFYIKHYMSAFEWKLNALNNKDKNLIIKMPQNWRHPISTRFKFYRVL